MAIKTISYTVSIAGISPGTKQFCGVQGNHNIYQLDFKLDETLWESLSAERNSGTLYYRFDLYNGEGDETNTTPRVLEKDVVALEVGNWLTRFGGVGKVVLVITRSENGVTHSELYSFPALLQFKSRPTGSEPDSAEYQSMTTLVVKAKEAADIAEAARLEAQKAADSAQDVKTAINDGMRLKLDGKRASGIADIFATISNEITETGENAVSGAAVFAAISKLTEHLNAAILEMEKTVFLAAHPVGSLYWTDDPNFKEDAFGGKWERITDTFIWAAGDDDVIGELKGNKTVTLTAENIAPHTHTNIYFNEIGVSFRRYTENDNKNKYAMGWQRNSEIGVYSESLITTGENNYGLDKDGKAKTQQPVNIMPPYKAYYCWIRLSDDAEVTPDNTTKGTEGG